MKTSEFITALQNLAKTAGDLDVTFTDSNAATNYEPIAADVTISLATQQATGTLVVHLAVLPDPVAAATVADAAPAPPGG